MARQLFFKNFHQPTEMQRPKAFDYINGRRSSQGIGLRGEVITGGPSIPIACKVLDGPGRKGI